MQAHMPAELYAIPLVLLLLFFAAYRLRRAPLVTGALLSASLVLFFGLFFTQNYQSDIFAVRLAALLPPILFSFFLGFGVYIFIAFLVFNTYAVLKKEKRDLQHILTLILAVGLLLAVLLPRWVHLTGFPPIATYLLYSAYGLAIYYLLHLVQFMISVVLCNLSRPRPPQDYIIVLGCWVRGGRATPLLAKRIDKAIEFYNRQKKTGPPPKLILSGGKGSDESCAEAEAMAKYALEKGIPREDLLLETKSVSTLENMKFSKEMMDRESGGKPYRCIYATNNYHLLRAGIFARKAGLTIDGIGAKTAFYYLPNAILREYIAYGYIYLKWNIAFGICSLILGSVAISYVMKLTAPGA